MDYQITSESIGDQLRMAMRHWASGIGIATTKHLGKRYGLTVSSFTSVSVEPPVILISVHQDSQAHDPILNAGHFAVTLLADDQQELSDRFAGRTVTDEERFDGLETSSLQTGSPILPGGLAVIDCELIGTFETSTTTVMFGEVLAAQVSSKPIEDLRPLLYYQQDYAGLGKR